MNAPKVARLLGDEVRTVQYWVERFNQDGFAGLVEGERPGRPGKLSTEQLEELEVILRASPRLQSVSANLWDGKTLSHWQGDLVKMACAFCGEQGTGQISRI
jgi:transposase